MHTTDLQKAYICVSIASIWMVTLPVIVGATITARPGLPTISRMMEDHPLVIPYMWDIFAMIMFAVGSVAAFVARASPCLRCARVALTILQFACIILVPQTSLDYAYGAHMAMASMVVVFTILKSLSFMGTSPNRITFAMHAFSIFIISLLGTVFVIFANLRPNAEAETNIALAEYLLMQMVAMINIFYFPDLHDYKSLDEMDL